MTSPPFLCADAYVERAGYQSANRCITGLWRAKGFGILKIAKTLDIRKSRCETITPWAAAGLRPLC
jgi:hypothetical protein